MKRRIKKKEYEYYINKDAYKRCNNRMIEDKKEREYFEDHNCPNCESGQIYYRKKTKDYKCRVCKCEFYFKNNAYEIIHFKLTIDDLRVIKGWLLVILSKISYTENLKKVVNKVGRIIKAGRGKIV